MEPKIRNFRAIEKFIRTNPSAAIGIAAHWQNFLKETGQKNPEIFLITTPEGWYKWVDSHSELDVDPDLWAAKEIGVALPLVRPPEAYQTNIQPSQGLVSERTIGGLSALPLALLIRDRPEIIEDDKAYKKIGQELVIKWQENNPGKSFDSKEGLDYLYGKLDGKEGAILDQEAENLFRTRFAKKAQYYDRRKKKTYKNFQEDPAYRRADIRMQEEFDRRMALSSKEGKPDVKIADVIAERRFYDFVKRYPEKAKVYAERHEGIKRAYDKIKTQEELEVYQAKTGKEVKYTEKVHRGTRTITPEQAAEQLVKVASRPQVTPSGLEIPSGIKMPEALAPAAESPPLPPFRMPTRIPSPTFIRGAPVRLVALGARGIAAAGTGIAALANPVTLTVLLLFVLGLILILFGTGFTGAPPPGGPPGPVTSITPAPPIAGTSNCPLSGNIKTTTGTKAFPEGTPPSGHCGIRYPTGTSWCSEASLNATQTSKATHAIDVSAGGKTDVSTVLPTVGGERVTWTLLQILPMTFIGGGLDFTGESPSGKKYFLHLYHLDGKGSNITGFTNKSSFTSGDVVATALFLLKPEDGGPHLHFTIATRDDKNNWVMLEPNGQLHMCDGKTTSPPTSIENFALGKSSNGTPITGWKFGNGSSAIAIVAGMNSGEEQGEAVVQAVYDELKKGSSSIIKPSANTTLYLIKKIDPSSTTGGFNSRGQDINRNFQSSVPGGEWSATGCSCGRYSGGILTSCDNPVTYNKFKTYCDKAGYYPESKSYSKTQGETCSDGFHNAGEPKQFSCLDGLTGRGEPFTEEETIVLRDFMKSKNIKAVLSFRAPYNNVSHTNAALTGSDKTKDLAIKMAGWLGIPYHEYWQAYPVRGQFMDWLYTEGAIGVEIEVPNINSGKYLQPIQNAIQYLSP